MVLVEKQEGNTNEDDPCNVENILIILEKANGMEKIGDLWLKKPSYD